MSSNLDAPSLPKRSLGAIEVRPGPVAYWVPPVARSGPGKIGLAYGHHRATVFCD
jgi:hypothetical protein